MQSNSNNLSTRSHKVGLFSTLVFLTGFLILMEISFLIACSGMYFGDFKLVSSHLKIPTLIVPGVLYFLLAQLLVHFGYTVAMWGVARLAARATHLSPQKTERLGIGLWTTGLLAIVCANHVFFPNSKFSFILLGWMNMTIAKILLSASLAVIGVALCLAIVGLFFSFKKYVISGLSAAVVMLLAWSYYPRAGAMDAATVEKPNIIIIGIDSVRPDFLSFFGHNKPTPHIDNFLNQATVFSESVTALARTYPSWVSILTGLYPKLNHARTNLIDQHQLDLSETLPAILQRNGYKTIFGTDETRFSNIDQRYGFDEIATTPIGFNDFLLGSLNDFPISNLLVNTVIGKYLFPHSYANRGVYATYDPDAFIHLLKPVLAEPRTKPLFLVVHFCLPHYPYAWASMGVKKVSIRHYQAALLRADQQFQDFMQLLEQDNLLKHSIVVLLSDHGEGVEMKGDRLTDPDLFIAGNNNPKKIIPHFYPPSAAREKVNTSGGHGTDVLGLPQYHTVLAFRTFGMVPNQQKIITGLVSLLDIKPTILDILKLPSGNISGLSLTQNIFRNKTIAPARNDFFTESDFSPEAIRSVHPETRRVLFEGIDYFKIDQSTARIVVRDSMLNMIISSKQYADFYGDWVLALYPQNNITMMPVLVNLRTGEWTNDLTTPFAQKSPAKHMLGAMKAFFGSDIFSKLSP